MLAYVIIPHQGDFLDSISLSTSLPNQSALVEAQQQSLTPFQAVLRGLKITPESGGHAHTLANQGISHPESFVTAQTPEFKTIQVITQEVNTAVRISFPQAPLPVYQESHPLPPPLSAHIASTVLLI